MKLKLITAVILLIITGSIVNAQEIDFSGNWKINLEKSTLNDSDGFTKTYSISQKKNELSLKWIIALPDGTDATWTEEIALGGGVSTTFLPSLRRTRFMSATFSADGKNVQLNKKLSKINKPDEIENYYQLNERWSLSADGKELLVEKTTPANPALMTKAFYSK